MKQHITYIIAIIMFVGAFSLFGADTPVAPAADLMPTIQSVIAIIATICGIIVKLRKNQSDAALADAVLVAEMSKEFLAQKDKRRIFGGVADEGDAGAIMSDSSKRLIRKVREQLGKAGQ